MKIETKYNFGDTVYRKVHSQEKAWKVCGFCDGEKEITGKNNAIARCPDCFGKGGEYVFADKTWTVSSFMTIGEVQITSRCEHKSDNDTVFDNYGDQEAKYEERYMCYETGIGSGTLWHKDDLFKTVVDAQMECDSLNALKE